MGERKIRDTTKIEVNHDSLLNSDTGFTSTGKSYSTSVGSAKGANVKDTSTYTNISNDTVTNNIGFQNATDIKNVSPDHNLNNSKSSTYNKAAYSASNNDYGHNSHNENYYNTGFMGKQLSDSSPKSRNISSTVRNKNISGENLRYASASDPSAIMEKKSHGFNSRTGSNNNIQNPGNNNGLNPSNNKYLANKDRVFNSRNSITKKAVRKATDTLTSGVKNIAEGEAVNTSQTEVSNWGAKESANTLDKAGELALKAGYSVKDYIELSKRVKKSDEIKEASSNLKSSIRNFKEGSMKIDENVIDIRMQERKKYGIPKDFYHKLEKSQKALQMKEIKNQKKSLKQLKKQKKLEIMESKKYKKKALKADSKRLLRKRMIKDAINKAENTGGESKENNMSTGFASYIGGRALEKLKNAVADTMNKLLIKLLKIITASIFSITGLSVIAFFVLILFLSSYQSRVEAGNYQSMYIYLRQKGFSAEGACGILGNIRQESDGDPACKTGGYYGLCQWNKEYYPELFEKPDWQTAQVQMDYLIDNLNTGTHCNGGTKLGQYLKNSKDTSMSAQEFCVGYEKCVNGHDTYTGNLYPEYHGAKYQDLNKRIAYALEFYDQYKNVAWEGVDINLNLSNVTNVFNIVANDFVNEIKVYDQGLTTRMKRNGFKTRADCSGFVYYYMSTVSGSDTMNFVPATGWMLIPSNFANISTGWQGKRISELKSLSDLQPGDVLVGTEHTEVYFGPNKAWGWGAARKSAEPYNTNFIFTGANVIQQNGGYSQTYSVVYRYGGF